MEDSGDFEKGSSVEDRSLTGVGSSVGVLNTRWSGVRVGSRGMEWVQG